MNDFEYYTNGISKLILLLEGSPTTIGYLFILWALNKWMVIFWFFEANCDSNCILMCTVLSLNSICSSFYFYQFYINSIAKLLWVFFSNPCFLGKMHIEREKPMVALELRRMDSRGAALAAHGNQDFRARSYGDPLHGMQMWLKCEVIACLN